MSTNGQVECDEGLLNLPKRQEDPADSGARWFKTGQRPEPEPSHLGTIEAPHLEKVGVCCSGGGIRSAAFNLGALQALQKKDLLRKATYLAAVSGGSYIAASWCMVAKTGDGDSDAALIAASPPFEPGSPEEQYLRNRSSYLAPDGLSKLFMAFRVLFGLVFNLAFLALLLFPLGVVLSLVLYGQAYGHLNETSGQGHYAMHVPLLAWALLLALGSAICVIGLWMLLGRPKKDAWRYGLEAWANRLILATATSVVVFLVIPLLTKVALNAWHGGGKQPVKDATPAVGVGSFGAVLLAVALQLRAAAAGPASVLETAKGARAAFKRLGSRSRMALTYVAGTIAGPLLLVMMVVAGAAVALHSWHGSHPSYFTLTLSAVALTAFAILYFFADLNTWSLHPFYRRRLASAFALKRVKEADHAVAVERPYDQLVRLSESGLAANGDERWPILIVCAAANVSDPGATPPGRGVTSFTFSPTAIGGPLVGAKRTTEYEKALGTNRERDITLLAAVAMSGAALSPSMGKLTRKPFVFLMALANVRLGVWVPNPQRIDEWTKRFKGREDERRDELWKPRPIYMLRELLGINRLDSRFIYVSDGGHYENLGLVELLRRGCGRIYCFDASGGESFTNLGDAIAIARSELKVEIDIKPGDLVAKGKRKLAKKSCARGTIRYPDGTVGTLIYARTVMTKELPWDVHAYHEDDPNFPHTSTADQLYTDQKFEAYRELGWCAGNCAADEMAAAIESAPEPAATTAAGNGADVDPALAS